jgi:predicted CXXCH cytochrome family protein
VYWLVLAVAAWLITAPQPASAQDNQVCLACHQADGMSVAFPDGSALGATINPQVFEGSTHGQFPCVTCHEKYTEYPHPPLIARTARAYSVEAQAVCGTCHAERQQEFAASVHGQGLRLGLGDVPLCTSCHTAHGVIKTDTAAFRNNIPEVCGNCHADERIMRRYGLLPVYQTYLNEFHGVTTRLYRIVTPLESSPAAVCYDCHTAHSVQRTSEPGSQVHPDNLLGTCRRCHADAGRFFAAGWTEHKRPSLRDAPLVFLVQVFYWILIPSTLLVLVVLTGLDMWHFAVKKWGGGR